MVLELHCFVSIFPTSSGEGFFFFIAEWGIKPQPTGKPKSKTVKLLLWCAQETGTECIYSHAL